jgi:hypothetical protein
VREHVQDCYDRRVRVIVGVIAVLVAGCDDGEPVDPPCGTVRGDECGRDQPYCTDGCRLERVEVIAHWSFETRSGDTKSPCLPGDPEVVVYALGVAPGYGMQTSSPCASGEVPLMVKPVAVNLSVTSIADHVYMGGLDFMPVDGPGDLPTVVIYTDGGSVRVRWSINNGVGAPTCSAAGIKTVRFFIDGVAVMNGDLDCEVGTQSLHPILAGVHSLRVEGLDEALNVVATSTPVDVTVLEAALVTTNVVLDVMP